MAIYIPLTLGGGCSKIILKPDNFVSLPPLSALNGMNSEHEEGIVILMLVIPQE